MQPIPLSSTDRIAEIYYLYAEGQLPRVEARSTHNDPWFRALREGKTTICLKAYVNPWYDAEKRLFSNHTASIEYDEYEKWGAQAVCLV